MIQIDPQLKRRFEGLELRAWRLEGVKVKLQDLGLEDLKREVERQLRQKYTLERLKDERIFRAYRDFYWRLGIDPTKDRPAGEALVRRVLSGRSLPTINTAVDCYNLASAETGISMGAYDCSRLRGKLCLRLAKKGEEFLGIGFREPVRLKGNEPVLADKEKVFAVYPYRDSELTKITLDTSDILLVACGVPGVEGGELEQAGRKATQYLNRFCRPP